MRTLKKSLSLVLVLAMVCSFFVMGTSAAFEDQADIDAKYEEAVAVMSGIGILEGDGKNFNPDGTLTRAHAAALVVKMLKAQDYAAACTSTFTDTTGHWAEKAIAYCQTMGYINGVGNNKFAPDAPLKPADFAYLMMAIAGIDTKDALANYPLGGIALAVKKGFADVETLSAATATREIAASIAYAALNEGTKEVLGYRVWEEKNANTTFEAGTDIHVQYCETLADAKILAAALGVGHLAASTVSYGPVQSLAYNNFGVLTATGKTDIGYNYYLKYLDVDGIAGFNPLKDIALTDKIITDTVVGTYTAANSYAEVSAALGLAADYTADVYTNGKLTTDNSAITYNSTAKVAANSNTTVTVVVTADKEVNFLQRTESVVKAVKGLRDTTTTSPTYNKYAWTFQDVNNSNTVVYSTYAAADAYVANGYYIITDVDGDSTTAPVSIEAAKVVSGKLTATGTNYAKIDGVKYSVITKDANYYTLGTTYNFYLNTAGAVVWTGAPVATVSTVDGYAYVSTIQYIGNKSTASNLVGAAVPAALTVKAQIVDAAGEAKTVEIAHTFAADGQSATYAYTGAGTTTLDNTVKTVNENAWCSYTINEDGEYSFTEVGSKTFANAAAKTATVTVDSVAHYMNAKTVINFYKYNTVTKGIEKSSITGYTAITADIATAINAATVAVVTADANKVISAIDVYGTYTPASAVNFAFYAGAGEVAYVNGAPVQYYAFVVNGEATSYPIAAAYASDFASLIGGTLAAGDLVTFTVDAKGEVTAVTEFTPDSTTNIGGVNYVSKTGVQVASISADGTYFINGELTPAVVMLADGYVVYDTAVNGYAVTELVANDVQVVTTITVNSAVVAIVITTPAA